MNSKAENFDILSFICDDFATYQHQEEIFQTSPSTSTSTSVISRSPNPFFELFDEYQNLVSTKPDTPQQEFEPNKTLEISDEGIQQILQENVCSR